MTELRKIVLLQRVKITTRAKKKTVELSLTICTLVLFCKRQRTASPEKEVLRRKPDTIVYYRELPVQPTKPTQLYDWQK